MSDYQANIIIKNPATPTGPASTGRAPGIWKLSDVAYWVKQGVWPNPAVNPDPYFPYVPFLLSTTALGNANNNLFVDSSGAFGPISRSGNTTQGSFSPYATNWSNYFDGSGDYLSIPTSSSLNFGTGNWTVECWVYLSSRTTNYPLIFGNNRGSFTTDALALTASNSDNASYNDKFVFAWGSSGFSSPSAGNSFLLVSNATNSNNTWYHVALVRSGTSIKMYRNGVEVASATVSAGATFSWGFNGSLIGGGNWDGANGYMNGYVSNLRVTGSAVYTGAFTPPTSPLLAISGTVYLTCQSNRFRDNSSNNLTITRNGDTSVQDFGPFSPAYPGLTTYNQSDITNWSGYFDGSGDYLTQSSVALGSGSFTVEMWVYLTSLPNAQNALFSCGTSDGSTNCIWYLNSSGNLILYSSGDIATTSTTVPLNQWVHLAIVRNGTSVTNYINGVARGTGTTSRNFSSTPFQIFQGYGGISASPIGYASNLRVVVGTAVYTSNFTPPTTNLTAISGTSLLTCQSAAFTDNSSNSFPITINGNPTVTGNSPFNTVGYWSNYFDGTDDAVVAPNTPANFSSNNFTAECWVMFTTNSIGYQPIMANQGTGDAQGWVMTTETNNRLYFYYSINGSSWAGSIDTGITPTVGVWTHVAVVRNSNTFTFYVNGVASGTSTNSSALHSPSGNFRAGRYLYYPGGARTLTGWISNVRLVNGTAVYTSNFTPSTTPLTAITNTSLLTCQSSRFVDTSANAYSITIEGNPSVQSFDPFYTATVASNGGSMYFDGSGDQLFSSRDGRQFGNFTVECWIYLNAISGFPTFYAIGNESGGRISFQVTGGSLQYNIYGGGNVSLGGSLTTGQWYHIAFVRSGTTITGYLNGASTGSTTLSGTIGNANGSYISGISNGGDLITGYISDMRVTTGVALYTGSTYTVPTAPLTPTANTTVLVNGMNAGIYDATTINDVETFGNAQISYPSPFAPANYWATYLNGSSYLTVANNTALDVWDNGSGSFTVEAWIYATSSIGNNVSIVAKAPNNGSPSWSPGWAFQVFNGYLNVNTPGDSRLFNSNTTSVPLNQWVHCALVKSGSTVSIYQNGVRVGTITNSTAYSNTTDAVAIGVDRNFAGSKLTGFVSNVRMVKGTAVYDPTQATLTVPTSPLTAITNTSLLTCQNKTFIDNSTNAFTITSNGSPVAGAIGPFTATGGTSMYFDGNDDLLVSPSSPNLDFGTSDFTIEMWVNPSNFSGSGGANGLIVRRRTDTIGTGAWAVYLNASGNLLFQDVQNGSVIFTSSSALTVNKWQHVAVTRSGTTIRGFIDGVLVGSGTSSISYSSTWYLILGMYGTAGGSWPSGSRGSFFTGYMDDVRITRGIARYTSNFTPPTQPFPIY